MLINFLKDLIDCIVKFYAEHRAYFDLAQFIAGMTAIFI